MNAKLVKPCLAELVGTFTLIFVGVAATWGLGSADGASKLVLVALAHGLAIGVMVTATAAISGGHLNPAVTFGLWVGQKIEFTRMIAYWIAQLLGAAAAAFLLLLIADTDVIAGGTPDLAFKIAPNDGIVLEAILTFFLVFVVYGSAVDGRAAKLGGLAIGLTIMMGVLIGGPLTGGAMNPARAFGPALASGHWNHHYVYWAGPLLGATLAGVIYGRFLIEPQK